MKNIHLILSALLISTPAFALGLTACDSPDDADLAAEVDRLQAENDALRAVARLSVIAPINAPALPAVTPREQGKPWQ